ncbi:MAG: efflux RND transporter periplasmic adaptor subunit [Pseudomonadota bacterium]
MFRHYKLRHYRCIALAIFSIFAPSVGWAADASNVTVENLGDIETFTVAEVSAEVISRNRAVLSLEVAGKVETIHVDVGDRVAPGTPLVSLDKASYLIAVRQAQARAASVDAQIQQAKIQLGRVEKLKAKSYASTEEVLEATTQLAVLERSHDQALADLALARLQLSRTTLKSAVDGVVENRTAQLGEYALPGTPMLTLTQTSNRQVAAEIFPSAARTLRESTEHWFESVGQVTPVKLQQISPVINPETRVQAVRFEFIDDTLPIGTIGTLKWREGDGRIPNTYLVLRGKQLGVFILEANRAVFHALPDAEAGRGARHNLPPTTKIISGGRMRLQDNDPVIAVSE